MTSQVPNFALVPLRAEGASASGDLAEGQRRYRAEAGETLAELAWNTPEQIAQSKAPSS